jgi:hypothetical protein
MWYLLCDPRQRCARISLACCHFHSSRVSNSSRGHCRLEERVRDRCRGLATPVDLAVSLPVKGCIYT